MHGFDTSLSEFLTTAVFIGFLTVTTLFVGFNFKIFKFVFKDNVKKYWWLFLITALIPLFLFLTISTYILDLKISQSVRFI
ncbi:hypothetical protein JXA63_01970 [Candidatus Woesebacteria bacterium]|nr:hypothetical protein [Candidatus Woesebacteria bacterium]